MREFTIILPVYNEADILENSVNKLIEIVKRYKTSFEIIIAEDGSTDNTDKIAMRLAKENPDIIKYRHSKKRLGRGLALKKCSRIVEGKYVIYMDVDLVEEFGKNLPKMLKYLREGFSIVIGSRYQAESKTKRSFLRKFLSLGYNFLQKILFGLPIKDLQCGFKGFEKKVFIEMNKETKTNDWFWDTEILIKSFMKGYKIKEIPVVWKEGKRTKVKVIRDAFKMGKNLFGLWLRLKF